MQVNESLFELTIAINTTSHAFTVKEFLLDMLKNNKVQIVTIYICGLSEIVLQNSVLLGLMKVSEFFRIWS